MHPAFEADVLFLGCQWPDLFVKWDAERRAFTGNGESPLFGLDQPSSNPPEDPRRPTGDEWELFWRILDKIGAWEWQAPQLSEHVICEVGDTSTLRVEHAGRSLKADFSPAHRRPRFFGLFQRALEALAGIPNCRSYLGLGEREQPAVESLTDLLRLADIVGAAIRKTPTAVALVCQGIEANLRAADLLLGILEELGPLRSEVLPTLIDHLGGNDEQAYWNLHALATFGSQARDAFPLLLERLESCAELRIFEAVKHAIIAIAPGDARLRARLPSLLSDRHQKLKLAGLAFQRVSPAFEPEVLDALIKTFESSDLLVLNGAMDAVQAMSANPPELLRFLHRSVGNRDVRGATLLRHCLANPQIKIRCLNLLAGLGDVARGELSLIADHLRDPNYGGRMAAVSAIAHIAPPHEALALTSGLLTDPVRMVRQLVIRELADLWPKAPAALPLLMGLVATADEADGDFAMSAICKSIADEDEIVRLFEPLLAHDRPETRLAAVKAIGRCRGESRPRIEMLLRMLDDERPSVRAQAIAELQGLRGERARHVLPAFCDALRDPATCATAAAAISSLREDGLAAVPVLTELLEAGRLEGIGQFYAARTLYELSPEHAARLTPQEVASLTQFGCHPIWTRDEVS
jgi:HEAT repeat protein